MVRRPRRTAVPEHLKIVAVDTVGQLLEAGYEPEAVEAVLAKGVDALIDWAEIIPGPLGQFVEERDGGILASLFGAIGKTLHEAFEKDPVKQRDRVRRRLDSAKKHGRTKRVKALTDRLAALEG
jgi:hypothetical protein